MRIKIIYDIESDVLNDFTEHLERLNPSEVVDLDITSYGGDIYVGSAICQKIREYQELGHVFNAYIYGLAASAAADIALCCNHVEMAESAAIMIHSAYRLDGKRDKGIEIANRYQLEIIQRRNPSFKESDLNTDKWFTAYEALEAGLVDGVFNISTNEIYKEAALISERYIAQHNKSLSKEEFMEEEKKDILEEKEEVSAEDENSVDIADIIERISERLKFIEDRLDRIEKGTNAACDNDKSNARLKALYDKIGAICAPAQRPTPKDTTPEEDLKRMNAKFPNLADIAQKLDR